MALRPSTFGSRNSVRLSNAGEPPPNGVVPIFSRNQPNLCGTQTNWPHDAEPIKSIPETARSEQPSKTLRERRTRPTGRNAKRLKLKDASAQLQPANIDLIPEIKTALNKAAQARGESLSLAANKVLGEALGIDLDHIIK